MDRRAPERAEPRVQPKRTVPQFRIRQSASEYRQALADRVADHRGLRSVLRVYHHPRQRQVVRQRGRTAHLHSVPDERRRVLRDLLRDVQPAAFGRADPVADGHVHADPARLDRQAFPVRKPIRVLEHDADLGRA